MIDPNFAGSELGMIDISASGRSLPLLPVTVVVFIAFLTMGLALPVLPLHVHHTLGMGEAVVGVVAGAQFAAALLSRIQAGILADTRGAKRSTQVGLLAAALSGLVYYASLLLLQAPVASVVVLIVGRLLIGCAESFIVTGTLTWGVALVGPQNAGKVIAWVGIAMYAAYAVGAPVGVYIYARHGFWGIAGATVLVPLIALACMLPLAPVAPPAARRPPFYKVIGAVWLPGLGLAFCSVGFGAITAFIALLYSNKGWGGTSLVFTIFGVAFIGARIFFSDLPDKIGGAKVALVCVLIEAIGQFLIWQAPVPTVAYLGAALTGFGYSLAFPGFGVEAVRVAPPQSRGMAMGAYVAFLDISLGLAGPLLGIVGHHYTIAAIYLVSGVVVFSASLVAAALLRARSAPSLP
jgi:MFS family permease